MFLVGCRVGLLVCVCVCVCSVCVKVWLFLVFSSWKWNNIERVVVFFAASPLVSTSSASSRSEFRSFASHGSRNTETALSRSMSLIWLCRHVMTDVQASFVEFLFCDQGTELYFVLWHVGCAPTKQNPLGNTENCVQHYFIPIVNLSFIVFLYPK